MADITELLHLINPDLEQIESAIRVDIDSLAEDVDDLLLEILQYGLFGGGKRFRPLLAVITARLCDCHAKEIFKLSIAFEYLHVATLFHDDVIDEADMRRGKPSVCNAYGIAPAILAGDFLHARAMAIIGEYGGSEALGIFCKATSGMVDGEFLQLRNAENFNQSEKDYFDAIQGKTALLIAATTEIGGLYGGAGKSKRKALAKYGNSLGCAFQIVDDLLDYKGQESNTGKAVGNDLVEGKMTLPVILTLEQADSNDRKRLLAILANPDIRKNSFQEVFDLMEKYNGFSRAIQRAEQCIAQAIQQLENFPEEKVKEKNILIALAQYALVRQK